jgi:hypothetical protein
VAAESDPAVAPGRSPGREARRGGEKPGLPETGVPPCWCSADPDQEREQQQLRGRDALKTNSSYWTHTKLIRLSRNIGWIAESSNPNFCNLVPSTSHA